VLPLLVLKSRARLLLLALMVVGAVVAASIMPGGWMQRMETIRTYQEDISATQRLNSWWVAYNLAKDSPVLGGGFRTFSFEIYQAYIPGYAYASLQHDAHSIYLQVLGEHGFPGLALYLALIISTLLSLRSLVRSTRNRPHQEWIGDCARMIQVSLAAYLVSGTFLSMSYFDLFYHLVAITVLLKVFAAQPVAEETAVGVPPMVPTPAQRRFAGA
jgi:probable O-glycosylation ligase (exosortase A-associated)